MEKINAIRQECADRVFYTVGRIGYQHSVSVEEFTEGVNIVFDYGRYSPLYNEEIMALCAEFNNAILNRDGLILYD